MMLQRPIGPHSCGARRAGHGRIAWRQWLPRCSRPPRNAAKPSDRPQRFAWCARVAPMGWSTLWCAACESAGRWPSVRRRRSDRRPDAGARPGGGVGVRRRVDRVVRGARAVRPTRPLRGDARLNTRAKGIGGVLRGALVLCRLRRSLDLVITALQGPWRAFLARRAVSGR